MGTKCILLACLAFVGCNQEPPAPFRTHVIVTGDLGKGLGDVPILVNGVAVAKTDSAGQSTLMLAGEEGGQVELSVQCPEDSMPAKAQAIPLRHTLGTKAPQFEIVCQAAFHTAVIVVRAEGGANLPVLHRGDVVAHTNSLGVAHISLRVRPNESFPIMLDTSAKEAESLRPQNPAATFTLHAEDEVFVFDQKFSRAKRKQAIGAFSVGPRRI